MKKLSQSGGELCAPLSVKELAKMLGMTWGAKDRARLLRFLRRRERTLGMEILLRDSTSPRGPWWTTRALLLVSCPMLFSTRDTLQEMLREDIDEIHEKVLTIAARQDKQAKILAAHIKNADRHVNNCEQP